MTMLAENESESVFAWRELQLAELGLCTSDATIAALLDVDWHELERLVRAGCDPETALRILA